MRSSFVTKLMDLAERDPNVLLLTGDLGFGSFEPFWERFPQQFFNLGIAEQNMIGVAAGLALSGKKVFVYSIGNFPTLRCLEQIRNDVCYHNLNVVIVAQGGGFNYGGLGMSHHATEDLSIMRALPNMKVVAPSCRSDIDSFMDWMLSVGGPSYLRLEKTSLENLLDEDLDVVPCQARSLEEGLDVAIVAIGGISSEAWSAVKLLKARGVFCTFIEMHTLKPFDRAVIEKYSAKVKCIITVEENNICGGLFSSVCEIVAGSGFGTKVVPIGLADCYSSVVGDQDYLRRYYQMACDDIVGAALSSLGLS